MCSIKKTVTRILFLTIAFFIFTGQTGLEAQMRELDRLQQQLKSLQTEAGKKTEDDIKKVKSLEEIENDTLDAPGRYQLFSMDYKQYHGKVNGISELKGVMKIDTYTGSTWIYVLENDEGFWKKIEYSE